MQLIRLAGAMIASLLMFTPAQIVSAEEDRFSPGNRWLNEVTGQLESIAELQVPILQSSNALASFVIGQTSFEDTEYILENRKSSMNIIKDSLQFGQTLMSEQPTSGGSRSGPYLQKIGNLNQKLDEIYAYSDEAMAGYEKTLKGDTAAYRGAELAMIKAISRTSDLIDIYYQIKLEDYPSETHPDRSRYETIRYWDLGFSAAVRMLRLHIVEADQQDTLMASRDLDTAIKRLREVIEKGRRDTAASIKELQELPADNPHMGVEERLSQLAHYETWWSTEERVANQFDALRSLLTAPEVDNEAIDKIMDEIVAVAKDREKFNLRLMGLEGPPPMTMREVTEEFFSQPEDQTPSEGSAVASD